MESDEKRMIVQQQNTRTVVRKGNKYYHIGTKNKSFLEVSRDLKELGIKNHYFMLELKNPNVANLDPYSDNLTIEQISDIINECMVNPWYYLREVARIPTDGGVPIRYKANRGNIAQAWCLLHGVDSWLVLPRQQGKTISFLSLSGWAYSFGTNNSTFIFVNKDGDNAKENLNRVKLQIECLPKYMQFESILEEDDETGKVKVVKAVKNATTMKHPITNNKIITKNKATTYDSALSLARGLTSALQHFDEPEFTNHIKTIVENSVSTFETASRNARANGALFGRVFTCTPGETKDLPSYSNVGRKLYELLGNSKALLATA